jgi:hypothetical protein
MKCVRWRAAGGERLARPFANHAGLKLGDTRHLLQRKPAGCAFDGRHVDEANLDVCGEELRQEGDAAGQARDVGDYESGRSGERPKLEAALQLCRAHRAALASRWMSWGFDGERLTTAIKFLGTQGVQAR